ncbi:hypothetical protein [Bradyrhizobium sp. USDA 3458]|uniref:hypothetical protein n=1 Tax=Bradyrhizobium sp. USDA 3458 TaxID=2591461 RepID=UPI001142BF62|nr:hypothetical protein [Bradyrhizobium sp. USDA 3458]
MSDEANGASNAPSEGVVESAAQVQPEAQISEKPAGSAREAIERALAKVGTEPSGETRPAAEDGRQRDATGKFVKAEAKPAQPEAQASPVPAAPELKAPSRFVKNAHEFWGQTPEIIRQETERAINELTQGLEKYKGEADTFAPIRKYHDMALQSGTTLDKALENYVGIETALRQDPLQGFLAISRNIGLDPAQFAGFLHAQLTGQGGQQPQGDTMQVSALKQQIAVLEKQIGEFGKTFTESQQQARVKEKEAEVNAFAKDNPYFEDLAPTITQLLESGFSKDLSDAYAKAVRLNPEVEAKIEAEKAAKAAPKPDPAQTREKASKSITGSPSSGSNPATKGAPASAREALTNRFAELGIH